MTTRGVAAGVGAFSVLLASAAAAQAPASEPSTDASKDEPLVVRDAKLLQEQFAAPERLETPAQPAPETPASPAGDPVPTDIADGGADNEPAPADKPKSQVSPQPALEQPAKSAAEEPVVENKPVETSAAASAANADLSTGVNASADMPAAAEAPIPIVRNNALQDVQLGETDDLMRLAFVCRRPCAITKRPDGGYLLEGVDADLRLDLTDRSKHANLLVLEAVGDASLILLDTEDRFVASTVRRCRAGQGPATCLDFQVTSVPAAPANSADAGDDGGVDRSVSARSTPQRQARSAPVDLQPQKNQQRSARVVSSAPSESGEKLAPAAAPPAPRIAERVKAEAQLAQIATRDGPPYLGAAIAPGIRETPDVGFSFNPPGRLGAPKVSEAAVNPEGAATPNAAANAPQSLADEKSPSEQLDGSQKNAAVSAPAIAPAVAPVATTRLEPPAAAPFSPDPVPAVSPKPMVDPIGDPVKETPQQRPSAIQSAGVKTARRSEPSADIVVPDSSDEAASDYEALFVETTAKLADIKTEAADILGMSIDADACDEARARLLADAWALEAMVDVGFCKAAGGETASADADFERLLAYTPDNYRALVGRALIAAGRGDAATAERFFQDALNALPPMEESDRIVAAMRRL
ncbi:MAG: hypothetical protein AAF224_04290 [Pseudomonadota bacterium]